MEIQDCQMYDDNLENIQNGFNGTYEPTDSFIVRSNEIPLEDMCKRKSDNDNIKDKSWTDNNDIELNQRLNCRLSKENESLDDKIVEYDKGEQPISVTISKYHQDGLAKSLSDSEEVDANTGDIRENLKSVLYDFSASSTEVVDVSVKKRKLEQNFNEIEETNNSKNDSPSEDSNHDSDFDSSYKNYKKTDSENSRGIEIDLFKTKGNVEDSHLVYRNETGQPSLVSPCTTALTEHQDLDPTQYGPNGNLDNRCELCGKTFSQPYLLKVHFRVHSGFKPYKCDLCNKGFAQSSGLRSHKLTHTGEKPYKCDICYKTFTASGSLNMHYRTHNGERPFSCEVCGRTFRYRSAMTKHIMIHTGDRPYTCEDCGKDFSRKGNLETHRRIHTNSLPYQCDICKKKFNQMSNLRTHEMTHTLVKPYKCDLCGSEFFTKFNMQRHIVIQHIKNKR